MKVETCGECGGRLVVSPEGFLVCSNCGLVAEDLVLDPYIPEREIKGAVPLGGIEYGSVVPSATCSYARRLSRLNAIVKYSDEMAMEREVLNELIAVSHELDVPRQVRDSAFLLYRRMARAIAEGISSEKRVNHFRVAAAALILACRLYGRPLPSHKVIKAFRRRGHTVTLSNVLEALHIARRRGVAPRPTISEILARYASILRRHGVNLHERSIEIAAKLLDSTPRVYVGGRDPHLLALAALYLALRYEGGDVSYYKVAKITGRSASSVRANVKLLERVALCSVARFSLNK